MGEEGWEVHAMLPAFYVLAAMPNTRAGGEGCHVQQCPRCWMTASVGNTTRLHWEACWGRRNPGNRRLNPRWGTLEAGVVAAVGAEPHWGAAWGSVPGKGSIWGFGRRLVSPAAWARWGPRPGWGTIQSTPARQKLVSPFRG